MRVKLKGINRVRKRLADGTVTVYHYAWKGGPALPGNPGDPEFVAAYNAAIATKTRAKAGTLQQELDAFQQSSIWHTQLAPRTKRDYVKVILRIEKKFGHFPLAALADKRTKGLFLDWRDELAKTSPRQADYTWQVLSRILSWSLLRAKIPANPCVKGGRVYSGSRAENVWTMADEAAFFQKAPKQFHLAFMLGVWTGQRQGDLLALQWSQYDGSVIRLKQSKTGVRVMIPVGKPLKAMLDAVEDKSGHVLLTTRNTPWSEGGFSSSWVKARKAAGVVGVTFNDLRGTAVTRLAIAQCTEAEIATITGHTLREVRSILDKHYLSRDPAMAESAIRKLEKSMEFPTDRPTDEQLPSNQQEKCL